jgi:hypothetical protein
MTTTETHTSIEANALVVQYLGENWTPNIDNATERLIATTVSGIAGLEEKIIDRAHRTICAAEYILQTITTKGSVPSPDDWAGEIQVLRNERNLNLSFLNCMLHAYVQDN